MAVKKPTEKKVASEVKVLKFALEKETKNTRRYKEVTEGEPPIIGTLYLQSWYAGDAQEVEVAVTLK